MEIYFILIIMDFSQGFLSSYISTLECASKRFQTDRRFHFGKPLSKSETLAEASLELGERLKPKFQWIETEIFDSGFDFSFILIHNISYN